MRDDDFYEDDEPVGDVLAAFEAGEKVVTEPPRWGFDVRAGQKVRIMNVTIERGVRINR